MKNRIGELLGSFGSLLLGALQSAWGALTITLGWKIPRYDRYGLYAQAAIILVSLIWWELKGIIPTVAIGLLAFVAVVMTVRDEKIKESVWERSVWIVIAFALLIVEVNITYRDRADLDRRQADTLKEERDSFSRMLGEERQNFRQGRETFSLLQSFMFSLNQSKESRSRLSIEQPRAQAKVAKVEGLPAIDLKRKLSELSADIFSFLIARQAVEPKSPIPPIPDIKESMEKYFAVLHDHLEQTMALYDQKFTKRVEAVHESLIKRGIRDDELDEFYKNPTNTFGIETLARRIGIIADGFKQ